MNPKRLDDIIKKFPSRRIAVIGDFFLDKYLDIDPRIAEMSVESGKTAHQVTRIRHSPGAAGTVMNNLSALGAGMLYAVGFAGEDGEGYDLVNDLHAIRCDTKCLIRTHDRMTPTYLKPRDITDASLAGEHERYDTKNRTPLPRTLEDRIIAGLDALLPKLHAVIIADQVEQDDRGVITKRMRSVLADRAKKYSKVVFFADSRTHIRIFRNVIIKPNQFEAVGHENPMPGESVPEEKLKVALVRLRKETGAPVVITRGPKGMIVSDPTPTPVRGVKITGPTDTTGAGDSATAGCVLALASGATLPEAALAGNLVASITVQQLATTGVATPAQVRARLKLWIKQGKNNE